MNRVEIDCATHRERVVTLTKEEEIDKTKCARLELIINNKPTSFEHIAASKEALLRYTFPSAGRTCPY